MFQKIKKTNFPPTEKPLLVWDGDCSFCKFWVTRWQKNTQGKVIFKTYQEVASQFPDIPLKEFKKASRFITIKGGVYSGPDSAYMSYLVANPSSFWHHWYINYSWFEKLSDTAYNFIAHHRSEMFQLTKALFGSNPHSLKPYWILYVIGIAFGVYVFFQFL